VAAYARRHQLPGDSAALETEYQGAPWYVLFHGIYENRSDAAAALRELAPELPSGNRPWVRRIPSGGHLEALEQNP
jgi:septal ring-binding cell division protein DamX